LRKYQPLPLLLRTRLQSKKSIMNPLILTGFICFYLALLQPLSAEGIVKPPAPRIDQLVEQALTNNAELKFYEAEIAAAKGQRTQAGLWKNPEVSGEYGERRIKDSSGQLQNEGSTSSISITQTFEFPGKGSLRKAIANKDIELAEMGLHQFRWALEGRVRSLALRYEGARDNADAAAEISERSSGLIQLLQERPTAGTQQLLELHVMEGSVIELQQSAKEFIQAREEARIELNTLLGWPANQPLNLKVPASLPRLRIADMNQLILTGLSGNLQLKMRTLELDKAAKQLTAAKLDIAPDFSVGPFFSQDKAGDLEENFGGTVSVTLPLWNWNQGNIGTAQARKVQADALLLDARRKVEAEISRRFRAYELNRKQLEQIQAETINNLRNSSDLADRQYRTGAIGIQLFLEVQQQFLRTQQIRNQAVWELWNNWLDLELLTGGMGASNEVIK
jgi:outer membrane protein, heavy metal efflux system